MKTNEDARLKGSGSQMGGMSIRAWMATQLAAGMIGPETHPGSFPDIAKLSVEMADALIRELTK